MDSAPDPLELMRLGMRFYEAGDFASLRGLVHEDAEIQMAFLRGDIAYGRDGLEQALHAAANSVHQPRIDVWEEIDENAAIMHGQVRFPLDGRGFGDRPAAWLNVLKDGLMWRVRIYPTVEAARHAYETEFQPQLLARPDTDGT